MHRFVLAAPAGFVVDHIDKNTLNNTRENLQITTHARNVMRDRATGGVTRMANGRWRGRLRVDGKMKSVGCYATEADARADVERVRRMVWEDTEFNPLGTVL